MGLQNPLTVTYSEMYHCEQQNCFFTSFEVNNRYEFFQMSVAYLKD